MRRKTQWIRKVLRWATIGTVGIGAAIGLFIDRASDEGTKPCADRVGLAIQAGVDPGEALSMIRDARSDLERRRSAHVRALGQIHAQLDRAEAEQAPWLEGAVHDEEGMISELDQADAEFEDTQACLEGGDPR